MLQDIGGERHHAIRHGLREPLAEGTSKKTDNFLQSMYVFCSLFSCVFEIRNHEPSKIAQR